MAAFYVCSGVVMRLTKDKKVMLIGVPGTRILGFGIVLERS